MNSGTNSGEPQRTRLRLRHPRNEHWASGTRAIIEHRLRTWRRITTWSYRPSGRYKNTAESGWAEPAYATHSGPSAGAPEDDCKGYRSIEHHRWKGVGSIGRRGVDDTALGRLVGREWVDEGTPLPYHWQNKFYYAMKQNCRHLSKCRHYSSKYHINNGPVLWLSACRSWFTYVVSVLAFTCSTWLGPRLCAVPFVGLQCQWGWSC